MESAALRAARPRRASVGCLAAVGGLLLATSARPAAAASPMSAVCAPAGMGWLALTSLVNFGFSINAILDARTHPGYPGMEAAEAQIGVTAPQVLISTLGLAVALPTRCFDRPVEALIYVGIPLIWSTALLAHGAWSLYQVGRDPNNLLYSMGTVKSPLSLGSLGAHGPRMSLQPGLIAPQTLGLRLLGSY